MLRRSTLTAVVILSLAIALMAGGLVSANGGPGTISTQVMTLGTFMTGDQEVPGPGDPDGAGFAFVSLDGGNNRICYTLVVDGIAPATAAHIHVGDAGVAGPVVVPLNAPTSGASRACTTVSRTLLLAIAANPSGYYVNVHNASYPAGAVRGNLVQTDGQLR